MIRLNANEISWFNHNSHRLSVPAGTSAAAEIFARKGVHGIAQFHKAIIARDLNKIQELLDN